MRIRTLFSITLVMLALPALATAQKEPVETNPDLSVSFEVRLLKVPVGFCERAGVKLTGDATSTDKDIVRLLEAAQAERTANVMQFPKVTVEDGKTATVRNIEPQYFVTSIEVMKVKGTTIFVPMNKSFDLGDVLTLTGHVLADQKRVSVRANLTRTAVVGAVELVPVGTQITPVFEGGSQGQPIPFTQFLQVPNIKTEKAEKNAVVATGGTFVLGSWKETGERPAQKGFLKKQKPAPEYEIIVLVTPHVLKNEEPAAGVAPMPRAVPARVTKVFSVADLVTPTKPGQSGEDATAEYRRNADAIAKAVTESVRPGSWDTNGGRGRAEFFDIGCALVVTNTLDVVNEVGAWLEARRWLPKFGAATGPLNTDKPAPENRVNSVQKLRNVAAVDVVQAVNVYLQNKNLAADRRAVVVAEPVSNTVLVSAGPVIYEELLTLLASLDKAPPQVVMQAMVIEVPRGFLARSGVDDGAAPGTNSWTLSPREARMLAEQIRAAKGRGECDILSRPQVSVSDNQTGFVQVGQQYPVASPARAENATDPKPDVQYTPLGVSLRLTPRVAPDGKSVQVRAEAQFTTVAPGDMVAVTSRPPGALFPVTEFVRVPGFHTEKAEVTEAVRTGETLVVSLNGGAAARSFFGAIQAVINDKPETLVIITPHITTPADGGQK